MAKKKKGTGMGVLAATAATAATAAGVAAGYYFYASANAKKNRKIAAKWANDMKNDVVKQAKKARHINREQLLDIIDNAAAAYETVRTVDRKDLARAARELKSNWKELTGEVRPLAKGAARSAKASARKIASSAKSHVRKAVKTAKKTVR